MSTNDVRIEINTDEVRVYSPYNQDFVSRANKLNGAWKGQGRYWRFDLRDEDRVRDLCLAIYGYDGRSEDVDTVDLRLTLDLHSNDLYKQSYWRFGRQLLRRIGRDSPVQLGSGVVILAGEFPRSGGSRQYPLLVSKVGKVTEVILEVRDVPVSLVEADGGEDFEIVQERLAESVTVTLKGPALEKLAELRARTGDVTDEKIILVALKLLLKKDVSIAGDVDDLLAACRLAKDVLDHPEQKSRAAWNAIEALEAVIAKATQE